jgi:purine-binding chemotaxis protein CheW
VTHVIGSKYLEFSLGNEHYGVPLLSVREVISKPETTVIPNAPAYFIGIMNLRGQVISVIDLRKKLSIKSKSENSEEAVIIVQVESIQVGLVVDSIDRVLEITSMDQVTEMPDINTQVNSKFVQSVYKEKNHLTIFLKLAEVLDVQATIKHKAA